MLFARMGLLQGLRQIWIYGVQLVSMNSQVSDLFIVQSIRHSLLPCNDKYTHMDELEKMATIDEELIDVVVCCT